MKIYNFGSGPAMLPAEVMQQIHDEWFSWNSSGLSAVEWSHRDKVFEPMIHETKDILRELMRIPTNYEILFLQGGASLMWSILPMNVAWGKKAGFVLSGLWSEKAYKEGQKYLSAMIVANSGKNNMFTDYPKDNSWQVTDDLAYVHYCSNETIQGIEFQEVPEVNLPLVCDMSSNILSRKVAVEKFGAIYAGAQKNMGIAGLTVLIIRKDWLDIVHENSKLIPATLNFKNLSENLSLLNTPCTFAIYACNLVLKWLKNIGGVEVMEKINQSKAQMLYDYLDHSNFYQTTIHKSARSRMNVTFSLANENLQNNFLYESSLSGLKQLKGHRLQGGLRASIYNPMPIAGVEALISFLADFADKNK